MITQFDNIPAELRAVPQWVGWKLETRDGKATKVPYNAKTGNKAMSTGAATWCDFDTAKRAVESEKFTGLGFVVTEASGVVGIDFDHCLNPATGEIASWALEAVELLGTYTEITPSGEGLRCFCHGTLPPHGRKKGDIEMYVAGRFLTTTGNALPGYEHLGIEERNQQINALHASVWPPEAPRPAPVPTVPIDLDDRAMLDKAFNSTSGAKIRMLFDGNWEGAGYSSQSNADSALCYSLAFWTGRDPARMDSLFRLSGLMRAKWDEKRGAKTYGELTIERACAGTTNTYDPNRNRGPVIRLRGRGASHYARGDTPAQASEFNEEHGGEDEEHAALNNGLYAVEDGRTVMRIEKSTGKGEEKKVTEEFLPVADIAATITREYRSENGKAIFGIEGRTRNGRRIDLEIDADKITDPKIVSSMLSNAADAGCVFYAGREKHLGPSIKSFSVFDEVESWRRVTRTGWSLDGKEFFIPGFEAEDVSITLPRKLAYKVARPEGYQLEHGRLAFKALIECQRIEMMTVFVTSLLTPPLALNAGWRGDRYATFLTGRTGSWKSAVAFIGMALYGPDFADEDNAMKFGKGGSTNNARVGFFTHAGDMPLLVDNYKPKSETDKLELIELIHMVMEGGEKDRMNRNAENRETATIHAWPFFTGEDSVQEASSAARCLFIPLPLAPDDPAPLSHAQAQSHNLHYLGGAWIDWLLSYEGQRVAEYIKKEFSTVRTRWANQLRKMRPDMVNIYRVASNLAVNECTFTVACECPALAPILKPFESAYRAGLQEIGEGMGQHTAESVEANRYLDAIRSLLSSDEAYLCERVQNSKDMERRLKIGWQDSDGVYLIPQAAYAAVTKLLRDSGGLGGVSKATIHKQLDQLKHLVRRSKDDFAVAIRVGYPSTVTKVLHITRECIFGDESTVGGDDD